MKNQYEKEKAANVKNDNQKEGEFGYSYKRNYKKYVNVGRV